MASSVPECVAAAAAAAARRRRHQSNHRTLISTATLTLLILFLSSWVAYAAAKAATTATPPRLEESGTESESVTITDFNSSSAFLGAVAAASSSASASAFTATTALPYPYSSVSLNSSPVAIIAHQGITSSIADNNTTLGPLSDTPLLIEEFAAGEFVLPPLQSIFVSLVLLIVILGTVVGNVLVCIAVCMVRKLRRPCNYLLVSLALSDLCVALLVMPMALLYEVLEKWNFGPLLCDIWVSFDVLCCTASILNLCAISVDRYLAITKPLEYGVKRTPRRMMLCVMVVWLAAACISLPPLLILGNEHEDEDGMPICTVCQNFAYQIYATLGSFYIPLSVMLFVYYQIFRAARRIVLEEKRAQTHLQKALNGKGSPTAADPPLGHTELVSGNGQRHSSVGNTSLTYSTCGGLSSGGGAISGGPSGGHHGGHHGSGGGASGSTGLLGSPHHKKLRFQLAKEKKASTTLGIIMSAFTVCWLPFFILALIRPFETMHVPPSLSSLFLWLGYANSLLNPIIYATLNRDFRKPFQEILYFRCSSLNTMMRENYYQDQYGEPPSQRVMLGDERHGARESFL
ncbi:5-hydroxytryptamine receptor 1 [Drosophila persimilis]|uniref:5-hydroxytryptamine receptor 1 n=1 Tax=Drosophila pseudoobscura pseudoobscura TaxID=46245 RepID=A0A6I8ULS6_DROPS|nr:5-hydroxytryptamine receptor 1 [Drosophila pseudoobscura]XP_026851091.1 5-hydroxytryptamine receptor 1 [Drosophila persimilis]XP_026851092.1 5-hydroxytryptamine receptor 1 [Drosophila persimilis]